MDPKDVFERAAKGPTRAPAESKHSMFESVQEEVFGRVPLPISDPLPRAIEFRRQRESWFSFPYHCLMGIEYVPHSCLTLSFSTHVVVVSGRNLEALYKQLKKQTAEPPEAKASSSQ